MEQSLEVLARLRRNGSRESGSKVVRLWDRVPSMVVMYVCIAIVVE